MNWTLFYVKVHHTDIRQKKSAFEGCWLILLHLL